MKAAFPEAYYKWIAMHSREAELRDDMGQSLRRHRTVPLLPIHPLLASTLRKGKEAFWGEKFSELSPS